MVAEGYSTKTLANLLSIAGILIPISHSSQNKKAKLHSGTQ